MLLCFWALKQNHKTANDMFYSMMCCTSHRPSVSSWCFGLCCQSQVIRQLDDDPYCHLKLPDFNDDLDLKPNTVRICCGRQSEGDLRARQEWEWCLSLTFINDLWTSVKLLVRVEFTLETQTVQQGGKLMATPTRTRQRTNTEGLNRHRTKTQTRSKARNKLKTQKQHGWTGSNTKDQTDNNLYKRNTLGQDHNKQPTQTERKHLNAALWLPPMTLHSLFYLASFQQSILKLFAPELASFQTPFFTFSWLINWCVSCIKLAAAGSCRPAAGWLQEAAGRCRLQTPPNL